MRRRSISVFVISLTLSALACSSSEGAAPPDLDAAIEPGETCTPSCEGRTCGDDGCGGSCGECTGTTCAPPEVVCPAGCADLDADPKNCGSCGYECPEPAHGRATCSKGACGIACDSGFARCNGQCVNRRTDLDNCGLCGRTCKAPAGGAVACEEGTCVQRCPAGKTPCGDQCVDAKSDPENCGACGAKCPAPNVCSGGTCECPADKGVCGGACTDLQNDANNCGACGNVCETPFGAWTDWCSAGSCVKSCAPALVCGSNCCYPGQKCCYRSSGSYCTFGSC